MKRIPPVLLLSAGVSFLVLAVGCAKHADFVNLRQEVRATIQAQIQAQEKARERHEALNKRLQNLEVSQESNALEKRIRGLALRLQSLEDRMGRLEEMLRRQAAAPSRVPRSMPPDLSLPPAPSSEELEEPHLSDLPGLTPTTAFNEAYKDYLNGRYDLAVSGFQRFLQDFPSTSLAPNAHYWLGETYSHQRDYVRAMQSFERVVDEYPGNEKVPSALFKIGLAAMEIGDTAKARSALKRVIEDYSASNEAKLAKHKLAELR